MAFTGTPVVTKVSDKCWRITGVTLAGDASGTIGFSDKTSLAECSIVGPNWQPYALSDGDVVGLQDAFKVTVGFSTDVTTPVPISVVKTGTTHLLFAATLHNDTAATVSPSLEIYVEWAGH
jgi:hypothetical protein